MKYRVQSPHELKSTFEQRQEEKIHREHQALLAQQQETERLKEVRVTDYDTHMFVLWKR